MAERSLLRVAAMLTWLVAILEPARSVCGQAGGERMFGAAAVGEAQEPRLVVEIEPLVGVDASLRGLSVGPDGSVWASGSGGTVLRRDPQTGAVLTARLPGRPDADFRDVEAMNSRTARLMQIQSPASVLEVAVGDQTLVVRPLLEERRPEAFFDSIAFGENGRGFVFGDPLDGDLFLARTFDEGRSWERLRSPVLPIPGPGEAGFAASGTCIALPSEGRVRIATGGAVSRILGSDDSGETWFVADHPLASGSSTSGAYSIAFADREVGVVVGGDYTQPAQSVGTAAFTEDGGRSWRIGTETPVSGTPDSGAPDLGAPPVRTSESMRRDSGPMTGSVAPRRSSMPSGYRSAVAHFPPLGGRAFLAAGPSGMDLTMDGGRTWSRVRSAPGAHALAFDPSTGRMWFSGADGLFGSLFLEDPELRELCESLRSEHRLPALGIGLIEARRPARSFVLADESKIGPSSQPDSLPLARRRFMAGSITKVFTGTLLSLLAEQGEVDLDQPIGALLPADRTWPDPLRAITLAQLASHASGLPRMPPVRPDGGLVGLPGDELDPYGEVSLEGLFTGLAASPQTTVAGSYSGYSNLGFAVLGQVLAKAAGERFEDLVQGRIFDPLGMSSSSVESGEWLDRAMKDRSLVPGFDGIHLQPLPSLWHLGAYGPAGSLVCTVDDLLRFAQDHLRAARGEKTVLPRAALRLTHEARVAVDKSRSVGLGWQRIELGDDAFRLWHNGAVGGFQSLMILDPEIGRAVVLLTNRGPNPLVSPLDRLAPDLLEFLDERRRRPR